MNMLLTAQGVKENKNTKKICTVNEKVSQFLESQVSKVCMVAYWLMEEMDEEL